MKTLTQYLSMAMVALLLSTSMTSPVVAQTKKELIAAEAKAKVANKRHEEGQYLEAAVLFKAAYDLSKRPNWLFNCARMYQKAGRYEESIALFREYLKVSPDEEGKAEAEAHIMAMETTLAEKKRAQPPPTPAGPANSDPPKVTFVGPETDDTVVQEVPPPPGRALTYSLLGGGALIAIGSGAGLWIADENMKSANTMDFGIPDAENVYREKADKASSLRTLSYIGIGAGVASLGYGLYRFLTEPEQPKQEVRGKKIRVQPVVAPNGGGVVVNF